MANTYESVAFFNKEEAQEAIAILREKGESAAMEYLKQWHEPGEGTLISTRGNPWTEHPHVVEGDEYLMFYSLDVPYIGLVCKVF